jgi:hypothetical protein
MNSTLPDHLQALGDQLDGAWERRYGAGGRRMRTRRLRATSVGVALLAGAAAVAVLLAPWSGPGSVDQALAAVGKAPTDMVVHFTSVTRNASGTVLERTEIWGASSPPYARRWIIEGADAPATEQGAAGDQYTQYDPAGIVYIRTVAGGIAEGTHAADFAYGGEEVRAYLRDGQARDVGEVTVEGATVRRFTVSPAGGGRCVYDVQPDTFVAVSLSCTGLQGGNSSSEQWQYLPRPEHKELLSVVAQHPTARIDRAPVQACGKSRHTPSTPPCVSVSPGG